MSIERSLGVLPDSLSTFLQSDAVVSSDFSRELAIGPRGFQYFFEYINGPNESDSIERPESAFDAGMPGAMAIEELEHQVDLGRWKLKIGNMIVPVEVSTGRRKQYDELWLTCYSRLSKSGTMVILFLAH